MAVLTARSTQLTNPQPDGSRLRLFPSDNYGKRRVLAFEFPTGSAAGDAGSTIDLVRLPIGRQRLRPGESKLWYSAGGAGITMQIGIRPYLYDFNGRQTQAQDPVALSGGALDISAAANNVVLNAALWKYDLQPTEGIPIAGITSLVGSTGPHVFATFPGGFPANFLLRGFIELITE